MPQDLRTLHLLIHDAVKYALSTEKHSDVMGNPKRYATYFPSEASLEEQEHDGSDNDSTWEFSAPISPPRSPSGTSCITSNSSPAQDIAIRYRAGISFGFSDIRSSSTSQHSGPDSRGVASPAKPFDLGHVPADPDQDIKAAYRQSRHEALLKTYQEAVGIARSAGVGQDHKVVCNRPGCRDTLANVRALMYHLHIHDLDVGFIICPRCNGSYEGQRELRMHNCHVRSKQLPTCLLRETFRRIFRKFSF